MNEKHRKSCDFCGVFSVYKLKRTTPGYYYKKNGKRKMYPSFHR